jgi:hypothetical protein
MEERAGERRCPDEFMVSMHHSKIVEASHGWLV